MDAAPSVGAAAKPITESEFAALMAPFGRFESEPHLAVAVSGGADSLALALLADRWARAQGGRITGLTVDHRLRAEAAAEAAQVGAWLGARGIAHAILVRSGAKLRGDIQAAARRARYRLLEEWCARHGVLHLLLAHHREDQAETLLLRLTRGSGLDGLAGMAATVELRACRVLRPFLALTRARLAASLATLGQDWLVDPSNRDPAFARVRLRGAAEFLAAEGLSAERLAATAAHLARARRALEAAVAALLVQAAWVHPAGFAWLDGERLRAAPEEVGLRALAALTAALGGAEFPPRLAALEKLYHRLPSALAGGRTLGGCRFVPRHGRVLVCRELRAAAPPVPAHPAVRVDWDGRFQLCLPAEAPQGLTLGALGDGARGDLAEKAGTLPGAARACLPVLRDATGAVAAAPHINFVRPGSGLAALAPQALHFRPRRALTGAGFTVV
jgi:tRNA(Ile)-lysidine synthase